MKIDHKYIEECLKLIFEGIVGFFAFFGFLTFILTSLFIEDDSLIVITSDPEIRAFVEQESKEDKIEGKSHLRLDFKKDKE